MYLYWGRGAKQEINVQGCAENTLKQQWRRRKMQVNGIKVSKGKGGRKKKQVPIQIKQKIWWRQGSTIIPPEPKRPEAGPCTPKGALASGYCLAKTGSRVSFLFPVTTPAWLAASSAPSVTLKTPFKSRCSPRHRREVVDARVSTKTAGTLARRRAVIMQTRNEAPGNCKQTVSFTRPRRSRRALTFAFKLSLT